MAVIESNAVIGESASSTSLSALDGVNFFVAGMQAGFGPFVAVMLAERQWTQASIGMALSAGAVAGLLSQLPGGELLDFMRSKRFLVALGGIVVAVSAAMIALWPSRPVVFTALVLQGFTGGFLGPAIASVSLGLVGHPALGERLGRNQRFASGGVLAATGLMGAIGYFLSYQAIFFASSALAIPLLMALSRIDSSQIHFGRACGQPDHADDTPPPRTRRLKLSTNYGLVLFAGCLLLFQFANASMLPLAGEELAAQAGTRVSVIVSALIIVPQIVVTLSAPWVGREAQHRGRRPLLLLGFGALTARALLFAVTSNPWALVVSQLLDGISGATLGVLTALIVADLTRGTGRFNLAQGFVGTLAGVGASLSTTVFSFVAGNLGNGVAFAGIAAVGLILMVIVWFAMPETMPSGAGVSARPALR